MLTIFFLLNPAAVFSGPKNKIFLDEVFPIKANTHTRADKTEEHTERESSDEIFLLLFF
jgi:hypothetical protein